MVGVNTTRAGSEIVTPVKLFSKNLNPPSFFYLSRPMKEKFHIFLSFFPTSQTTLSNTDAVFKKVIKF